MAHSGWLNFEKMVWDWCSLDESDILRAIDLQVAGAFLDAVRPAATAVTVRYTLPVKLP